MIPQLGWAKPYSIIMIILMMTSYPIYTQSKQSASEIQIETVNAVTIDINQLSMITDSAMYQACQHWQLNKQQVKQFFELSENYSDYPYSLYYQIPCSITGTLKYQNKIWRFTIDGGATGVWQYKTDIKYFGCHKAACESLVILPTDGMITIN